MNTPLRVFADDARPRSEEPQLFAKTPEHAIEDLHLNGTELRVLTAMALLARNSFPDVRFSHAQIAFKTGKSKRTIRRIMVTLEDRGYAVQKNHRHIVLTYETRAAFKLESEPSKSGHKSSKRPKVAAPLLIQERVKERERSPSPAAVTGPPTTTAESNPEPPPDSAPPPPNGGPVDPERLSRLKGYATEPGVMGENARRALRDVVSRGRVDRAEAAVIETLLRPGNRNRLRGVLGKVPPQPVGASDPGSACPVYPEGQTRPENSEPAPSPAKCPP